MLCMVTQKGRQTQWADGFSWEKVSRIKISVYVYNVYQQILGAIFIHAADK